MLQITVIITPYEIKLWNRQSTILPFELFVIIPPQRYARVILER